MALTLLLAGLAVFSVGWPSEHDAPLMLYFAWLQDDLGKLMYRDVFEHQPLGAHLLYRGVAAVAGSSDLGLRLFDLAWLGALLALDYALLAPFGRRVAWAGAVLCGLAYLLHGPVDSLQRDYLMLLPIAGALLLESRERPAGELLRAGAVGLLLGLACTVKPQAGLLLLGFAGWHARAPAPPAPPRLAVLGALGLGVALPSATLALVLWRNDTLAPFLDVVWNYWPLFAQLDVVHRVIEGPHRLTYLLNHVRQLGGHGGWLAAGVLGVFVAVSSGVPGSRERRLPLLLGALALLSIGVTAAAGRFWPYHWFLFLHFAVLCSVLCLQERPGAAAGRVFPAAVLLGAVLFGLAPSASLRSALVGRESAYQVRVAEISDFLDAELLPGDTVQSLDWTAGAVHAMLRTRAPSATPFVTDFYFYHHVSNPWIQALRRRFLDEFQASRPRFVINVWGASKPWPTGRDTTRSFPELEALLARDYRVVLRRPEYSIYERLAPGADRTGL